MYINAKAYKAFFPILFVVNLEGDRILGSYSSGGNGGSYWFEYDATGRRHSISIGGMVFYYYYNAQGDVMGLRNTSGQSVVQYTYDSWGYVQTIQGTLASTLGYANPFFYRGYYMDTETGIYYLNSRYYDPETGRFLNADGQLAGVGGDIRGYNMFSYCFNNPVNMDDSTGQWPKWVKEIVNRVKYAVTMTVRVFTSPLKAIEAKAGVGVGIGGEVSAEVKGVTVSAAAKKSYTDSLQLKNGKIDVKSTNSQEIGVSVGKFSVGKSNGKEHSFFDENCTCDFIDTPFVKQAECYANKEFIEKNCTIGVSASLYVGIGFEASLGVNVNAFFDEIIDIYHTRYEGFY